MKIIAREIAVWRAGLAVAARIDGNDGVICRQSRRLELGFEIGASRPQSTGKTQECIFTVTRLLVEEIYAVCCNFVTPDVGQSSQGTNKTNRQPSEHQEGQHPGFFA
jgi:hypothetical protein